MLYSLISLMTRICFQENNLWASRHIFSHLFNSACLWPVVPHESDATKSELIVGYPAVKSKNAFRTDLTASLLYIQQWDPCITIRHNISWQIPTVWCHWGRWEQGWAQCLSSSHPDGCLILWRPETQRQISNSSDTTRYYLLHCYRKSTASTLLMVGEIACTYSEP